ncbi:hypothetical protein [uncultured Methylobacterium sp.]|jgi:hypothetical protein|uniref:hypothetical protein n=1 Tax=uncultured Methylobacterium sp. TaxID=157278 RepID=UPI002635C558|nr:hypothetical protein [uncultured Methylobacterium sp.]
MSPPIGAQVTVRQAFTPTALAGGSKAENKARTIALPSFKRAPTDERPKVSAGRYKGDDVLARPAGRGALMLGRLQRAFAPPRAPEPAPAVAAAPVAAPALPAAAAAAPAPLAGLRTTVAALRERVAAQEAPRPAVGQGRAGVHSRAEARTWLAGEFGRIGEQTAIRGEADKALADLGALLPARRAALAAAEAAAPPDAAAVTALRTEVAELTALRRELISVQIGNEFGGLGRLVSGLAPKGGAITAMWALHGPGATSMESRVNEGQIREIGRMVDAFNAGTTPVRWDNGSEATTASFSDRLEGVARRLEGASNRTLGDAAAREVRNLAAVFGIRAAHAEAVAHVEAILDTAPALPVGGALRAMTGMLPGLRDDGHAGDPAALGRAADSLNALAGWIRSGEPLPNLQGHDAGFDRAWLPLKQEAGGQRAVAFLHDQQARQSRSALSAETLAAGAPLLPLLDRADETLTVGERRQLLDLVGKGKWSTLAQARETLAQVRDERIEQIRASLSEDKLAAAGPLMPLLAKADDALTAHERTQLLAFVGTGERSTLAQAREMLAQVPAQTRAVQAARENGARAATLRHEVTALNRRFADTLTVDRRKWWNPATWSQKSVRVFHDSSSVMKDKAFQTALRAFGGRGAGRDVALMTARLARLELETMTAEKLGFGAHGDKHLAGWRPDPANPLAHVGIGNQDLATIGITAEEFGELQATVEAFNRQGIGSIDDVRTFTADIRSVAQMTFRSRGAQGLLDGYQSGSARAMGRHLLDVVVANADVTNRAASQGRAEQPVGIDGDSVTGHFRDQVATLRSGMEAADPGSWDRLREGATEYREIEGRIAYSYGGYRAVATEIENARKVLSDEAERGDLGVGTNPAARHALRDAAAIRTGLRAEAGAPGADEAARRRRLEAVADAIVLIREDGPTLQAQLGDRISDHGAALDAIVAERRAANPQLGAVTDMIRAAVLNEWLGAKADLTVKGDAVAEGFDPAAAPVRARIEARLAGWGVTTERFAPEIDSVLYARMSPADLQQWGREVQLSPPMRAELKAREPRFFQEGGGVAGAMAEIGRGAIDALTDRATMTPRTRGHLFALLGSFQEGDKLDLKAGQRIGLDSGKVPFEPSGIGGLKAKIAAARLGQFEIERGSDGYKLHLRAGYEGKGSLDVVAGKRVGFGFGEGGGEGSLGVEGSGSTLKGVSISFRNDADGLNALLDLVGKMVDGDEISHRDWKDATDLGTTTEGRRKVAVGLKGSAGVTLGGSPPWAVHHDRPDTLGAGASLGAGITGSKGWKNVSTDSLNQRTVKSEIEYAFTAGASAGLYARIYNPQNMGASRAARESGGQAGADAAFGTGAGWDDAKGTADDTGRVNMHDTVQNTDLLGVDVSKTWSYTDKSKIVFDASGFYDKCEKVLQSNRKGGVLGKFEAVHTPAMQKAIADPANPDLDRGIKQFMDLMGPEDALAVTYALRTERKAEANELVRRAQAERRAGNETFARVYETRADRIVADAENYFPSKIGLLSIDVRKNEVTNLNGRWVKWDSFSDGKTEHQGASISIPEPKA